MNDVDFAWPGGAAVAVSVTFDVDAEAGRLSEGEEFRHRLTTLSEGRYGVVRGTPRILAMLDRLSIQASFFVPGLTAQMHPHLVGQLMGHGHEIGHHGHLHLRNDKATSAQLREEMERGLRALTDAGATDISGYRSPAWEMTRDSFDLLVEHGFRYDSSCMGDDRPYLESWEGGSILELPVHWSLDDWPHFGWSLDSGGNLSDPAAVFASWREEYRNARAEGRHLVVTLHPEVIGRAHRLVHLERLLESLAAQGDVWFATLDQVARHVEPAMLGRRP